MESSFQKIIAAIVGVMIMFIIPVYIAFEKVDDISYNLVLKHTQSFVDNVRERGYISPEMYSDFVANIHSTNNSYDVQIEHVKKRYDPAIYIYGTKGEILHILDYDKYIDVYNAGRDAGNIKLEIDEGVYTDKNTEIRVEAPKIVITNASKKSYAPNTTEEEKEALYRDNLQNYKEQNFERIILDKGKIYADRNKLISLGKEYDEDVYIESNITLTPGVMTVANKQYQEPTNIMAYSSYIEKYDSAYTLNIAGTNYTVFNGPKFYSGNIKNTKAAMWIDNGKTYSELSPSQKQAAENMYYERIDDYKATGNQAIINSKGEIYSYSSSPNYESLTDYLATNIQVSGSISINNPSTWRATEIEFNETNVVTLRNGGTVVADVGGIFDSGRINIVEGSVIKKDTGKVLDYTDSFLNKMLDANSTITIERAEVYKNEDMYLSDDAKVTVKYIAYYTDPDDIDPYIENEPVYVEEEIKSITTLDEYIALKDELEHSNTVTVEGIVYTASSEQEIRISEPSKIYCFGQAASDIEISENISNYIEEYKTNGEIVFSREYDKDDLEVVFGQITLFDEAGNTKYIFNENENPNEYKNYKTEYHENGGQIEVETLEYSKEDVTISYEQIRIEYKDEAGNDNTKYLYSSQSGFLNYIEGYYQNKRIIVSTSEIYKNVNIIHPKIEIVSGSNVLYKYERESINPEEVALWERYSAQAISGMVTIVYKVDDVSVTRAKMTIVTTSGTTIEIKDNTDSDHNGVREYFGYKSEFENKGTVTFEGSKILNNSDMTVTHPSVTIYDRETGRVIKEYKVDFEAEDMLGEYDDRQDDYEADSVIIDNIITYESGKNCLITTGHTINEERITDEQIFEKLFSGIDITKTEFMSDCLAGNVDLYKSLAYINENSYLMNEGDEIIVTVKNRNQTIASTYYSLFTASVGLDDVAKIYVNYGGKIKNDGETLLRSEHGSIYTDEGRIFKYTGKAQEITLERGNYSVECWGASGGGYTDDTTGKYTGGAGAYTKLDLTVLHNEQTLYIYVGGMGSLYSEENINNGGWNGGGNSYLGYGGGGATDIRLLRGETDTDATSTSSLLSRIAVAGGGGGASKESGYGGFAGNLSTAGNGGPGELATYIGQGPKQETVADPIETKNGYVETFGAVEGVALAYENGILGIGGRADFLGSGAGGAGLIGGSASHNQFAGGGGGLSYIYKNRLFATSSENITYPKFWDNYDEVLRLDENLNTLMTTTDGSIIHWETVDDIAYIQNARWANIYTQNYVVHNGNSNMPNPLSFTGSSTVQGNIGNGYVRIRKLS